VGGTVTEGTDFTLSVTAGGSTPLTYQWYRDGAPVVGAVSSNLTFAPVRGSNAGTYQVIVGNALGTVASTQAVLHVTLIPPTFTQDLTNMAAATGDTVTFAPTVLGSSLSYQWFFNGTNPIDGATNATLILSNVQLTNEGIYQVRITNIAGITDSAAASLTVTASPPVFLNVPADVIADPGTSATFSASAFGSKPFLFQWFSKNEPLFAPTNGTFSFTNPVSGSVLRVTNTVSASTLTVTGLKFADEGDYVLGVQNSLGTNYSGPAVLEVNGN